MGIFGDHRHSFEADTDIQPLGRTARRTHPFNGIRWNFSYAVDLDDQGLASRVWMIWPEFVDSSGVSIDRTVPLQGRLHALMHIVDPESVELHRQRLKPSTRFVCTEGPRPVAGGVMTSLQPMT